MTYLNWLLVISIIYILGLLLDLRLKRMEIRSLFEEVKSQKEIAHVTYDLLEQLVENHRGIQLFKMKESVAVTVEGKTFLMSSKGGKINIEVMTPWGELSEGAKKYIS